MKRATLPVLAALLAGLSVAPGGAPAEEAPPPAERGAPLFPGEEDLRALRDYAEDLARRLGERLDPMAERLRALIDDIDAYEAPEMLPNGDILIRRKKEAPAPAPSGPEIPEGGVAL